MKTILLLFLVYPVLCFSQQNDESEYILGEEEKLEMIVHIWGEVQKPGEYRVSYDTNLLELISKAGGPTDFANLSNVRLTREGKEWYLSKEALKTLVTEAKAGRISEDRIDELLNTKLADRMLIYNMDDYLKDKKGVQVPPTLKPGDVVMIPHNNWYKWQDIIKVVHQVAVIASVYVWYLRVTQ